MSIQDASRTAELQALEETRRLLTARLFRNPADFAATTDLQAVIATSAGIRSQIAPSERDALVHAGLSNVERTRIWLHPAVGVRHERRTVLPLCAGL